MYGDRQGNNQGRTPLSQEEEHHEHHEEQSVQNRLLQGVDGVDDVLRRIVDYLYLDIVGQSPLDTGHLLLQVLAYLHGIGSGLLGHHQADTLTAVGLLVQAQVLDRVAHCGKIPHEDLPALGSHRHHDVVDLGALDILAAHLQLILLLVHLDGTGGEVQIVGGYRAADSLQGKTVGIQLLLVDVHVHITLRGAGKGKVSDTVHHAQLRDNLVVEQLVQTGIALVRSNRILEDRHGAGTELEDEGIGTAVGQLVLHHVYIGPDIVDDLVQVRAPLQLEQHHGDIVLGGGGYLLEVVDGVEVVLYDLGHVGLYLGGTGTRIDCKYGDVRRIHLRELVDRQPQEGEHAYHYHGDEHQEGRHRTVDR